MQLRKYQGCDNSRAATRHPASQRNIPRRNATHRNVMIARLEFSKRTKLIVWNRSGGRCEMCTAKLTTGGIEYHHKTECTMGGDDKPENCMVLCKTCHRSITKDRAPTIAKSTRQRAAHIGAKTKSRRSFPTNRNGAWKRKMNGTIERRT